MRAAKSSKPSQRSGREWLLAWLLCGSMASVAALAQSEADAIDPQPQTEAPAAAPPEAVDPAGNDADSPAGTEPESREVPDLVVAERDPVATNQASLTSTLEQFGAKSLQAAEAYVDLADAQRQAKLYEQAAENYLAAVESYRAVGGPFTPLAIAPLTNLGDNYHEANDDVNAVASYSEARTVSRRVYGLHNEDQIELLDRMSRSLLELNQLTEAEAQQIEALRLVQRANPPDSDAVLNAIYKYAEWLGARLLFQLERDQYMRALRIIRASYGDDDVRQVRPLLGIGNTYREERNPAGPGISALQDALNLLLNQPERDPLAIATALRDIGDWTVAFGKTGYNGTEYQQAWQLLGGVPNGDAYRRDWFTGANYVLYEPISPRGLSTDPSASSGHVTVKFDIDRSGNSNNVTLVESTPVGLKDEAVLRHIRRSRFRPQVADGEVIAGTGLAIQVKFRYIDEVAAGGDED